MHMMQLSRGPWCQRSSIQMSAKAIQVSSPLRRSYYNTAYLCLRKLRNTFAFIVSCNLVTYLCYSLRVITRHGALLISPWLARKVYGTAISRNCYISNIPTQTHNTQLISYSMQRSVRLLRGIRQVVWPSRQK